MAGRPSDGAASARRRIRDAALDLFAERGVGGTPLRAIAERARVSSALAVHHLGTEDGLRAACDEHVAATVREQEQASAATGAVTPTDFPRERAAVLTRWSLGALVKDHGSTRALDGLDLEVARGEVLDEPTWGLDPLLARAFPDMVREARERGATVLMPSHVLSALFVESVVARPARTASSSESAVWTRHQGTREPL